MIAHFDFESFKLLLKSLKPLIIANISFFDETFNGTYACTSPIDPFCALLKENLRNDCKKSDDEAMKRGKGDSCTGFHYFCHFGLKEMFFKMSNENETYGYILVGPFREKANTQQDLGRIAEYCRTYGFDEKTLTDAYFNVAEFSIEKYEAIRTIIYALFDYAIHKRIITLKNFALSTEIILYVKNNFSTGLTIEDLAAHFFISQKQLCSIIQKATGMPPKKYLTAVRVDKAKFLLLETDSPVKDIAAQVGILDYNYFTKVFKAHTGVTPSRYRKNRI